MFVFVLIIAATSAGVHSQRCAVKAYPQYPGPCNPIKSARGPCESPPIITCEGVYLPQTAMPVPVPVMPETMYIQQTVVPEIEIAMPVTTFVETTVPVIPFITELPNCPDLCFDDILISPLGCLDPILTIYGTKDVCPLPNLPVSPILPAASPVSALASPFSRLLPPVFECDCQNNYLKRVPIPPPFI